jgi:hypothetical protein
MSRFVLVRALLSLTVAVIGAVATAAPVPGEASGTVVFDGGAPAATESLAMTAAEAVPRLLPADDAGPGTVAGPTAGVSVATPLAPLVGPPAPPSLRPMAFEYSDAYYTRLKIHKYASFATLPLFGAQLVVGQKLYNGTGSDGTRSLHKGLVAATAALFAVNATTGAWNIWEARKDPNHHTKRTVHGILMIVAEAGFVATGVLAPEHGERNSRTGMVELEEGGTGRSTHRTLALVSMGVATVSYLMMLVH